MSRGSIVRMVAFCGMATLASGHAKADCGDWLRNVALPHLGCSARAIAEICAGERPVPTTPYCGGSEQPAAGSGDWCQTPVGGCQIHAQAALGQACLCPSPAGMVNGRIMRQ